MSRINCMEASGGRGNCHHTHLFMHRLYKASLTLDVYCAIANYKNVLYFAYCY